MSRRQRKGQKRRDKKLEKIPEKLQRKRERRGRERIRRMPSWIRNTLIVVVIVVIIIGAYVIIPKPGPPEEEPLLGTVFFLQQDRFYCDIQNSSDLNIDYVNTRYGVGVRAHPDDPIANQPLHIIISREYDETERNFTISENIFYDFFGNAYTIIPETTANTIEYSIGGIAPNFRSNDPQIQLEGLPFGFWGLFFGYDINGSNDVHLAQDRLDDMLTFNFTISIENGTLLYNTPTLVHCNITLNSLSQTRANGEPGVEFGYGEAYIEIPKLLYNDSTLIANITLAEVYQNGAKVADPPAPEVNNRTLLAFQDDFFVSLGFNSSWGFVFDLNVTALTNTTFNLIDFTLPQNEFWVQAGLNPGYLGDQPMHFPKAVAEVRTQHLPNIFQKNYTDIFIALPQVWANVSASPPNPGSAIVLRTPNKPHVINKHLPAFGTETNNRLRTWGVESALGFTFDWNMMLATETVTFVELRRAILFN